jgi:hypothetical protein
LIKSINIVSARGSSIKKLDFSEAISFYELLLTKANRRSSTVKRDVGLVKEFLSYVTSKHLSISSDVLNKYLEEHYQSE